MPVQSRAQPLLIQKVRNKPNTPPKHKQAVQHTIGQILLGFFSGKGTAIPHQIDEADGDGAVDVQD